MGVRSTRAFAVRANDWGSSPAVFRAHWEIPDVRFRGLSIIRRDNEVAGRGIGRDPAIFQFCWKRNWQ